MVVVQRAPEQSRLIWTTRRVLAVQAVATIVAIVLAAPDFIDRLQRPTTCGPDCIDVRGMVFIMLLLCLTPVAAAVTAAALLLRQGRIWPAWLSLGVNLLVLASVASAGLQLITGASSCSDMCESFDFGHVPLLVQQAEVILLAVPPVASLVMSMLLITWHFIKPSRPRSTALGT